MTSLVCDDDNWIGLHIMYGAWCAQYFQLEMLEVEQIRSKEVY
jgi:hypothetical protein